MADPGIKKVIIPKAKLPAISGENQGYVVRYRIVSDDKNRTSHWSPQYKLNLGPVDTIDYSITVDQSNNTFNVIWESVPDISVYDIYIKIDTNDWKYVTSLSTTTYSGLVNAAWSHIRIAVQVPTYPRGRYDDATLFVTPQTNV